MTVDSPKLFRHLLSTSSLTLLSRISGVLRDITIASVFGASSITDAFVLAFRIPNLFRAFFAEGAFSQAFVPTLSKLQQRSPEDERQFIDNSFGLLALCAGLLALFGSLFAPQITSVFAQGYDDPNQLKLVSDLLRITFPYIFFISLTAFAASVLQCNQHFFAPAFAPVLTNISIIFFAMVMADYFAVPIESLAWAIVCAGVLQLSVQIIPLHGIKRLPIPKPSLSNPNVKKVMLLMLPIIASSSITQISMTIDSLLATFLESGTIFWLYLGNRVVGLPLGIFGVSIAIIILPTLARQLANKQQDAYRKTFNWGLHIIFLIGIPASAALIVIAEPVITLLFHYRQFDAKDVSQTGLALQMYALGLTGFMLVKVLVNAFLANGDAKNPVRCIMIASSSNIALSITLMPILGFMGLALSTSFSALLNVFMLYVIGLRKNYFQYSWQAIPAALRILLASGVMVAMLLLLQQPTSSWVDFPIFQRIWNMMILVGAGIASYGAVLFICGWRWSAHKI